MSSLDTTITGSFTGLASSATMSAAKEQRLSVVLSGTFSATVVLEKSRSLLAWERVQSFTSAQSYRHQVERGEFYRLRCSAYASGTATFELRGFDASQIEEDHWDDLRFAAAGINPPGAASDPTRDTDDGCLLFVHNLTNIIAVQSVMPHPWKSGSFVVPHVHWEKPVGASGNVVWELQWKVAEAGQLFSDWATITASTAVPGTPDDNSAGRHLITSFGPINLGVRDVAPLVKFKVSRLGGDAADTYGSNAKLNEFDVHYLKDGLGSGGEFTK